MKEIKTYQLKDSTVRLKGEYWIGDPCYIFPDKEWQKLCNLMWNNHTKDFDDTEHIRVVEVDGVKAYLFGTAHGDGCYELKDNGEVIGDLGVDAGMLSVIPSSIVKLRGWGKSRKHGEFVEFNGKSPMYVSNGNFEYGNITINTFGEEEEYDEWDDYHDGDDDEIYMDDDEDYSTNPGDREN